MNQWWSWGLAAVGIAGLYFAGSGKRIGWAIGLSAQALWVVYAVVTEQYGFIVAAGAYSGMYARNWIRWSGPRPESGALARWLRLMRARERVRVHQSQRSTGDHSVQVMIAGTRAPLCGSFFEHPPHVGCPGWPNGH